MATQLYCPLLGMKECHNLVRNLDHLCHYGWQLKPINLTKGRNVFLSGINNDVMVLLPFLERYKHSANFHDVMNSTSAFYSTNQIAQVMEYST